MAEYLSREDFDYMWSLAMQKMEKLEQRIEALEKLVILERDE